LVGRGDMLAHLRNQSCLKRVAWPQDRSPATKKESWTAAGSQKVKQKERAGRRYIIALRVEGVKFDTPVSPPFWLRE